MRRKRCWKQTDYRSVDHSPTSTLVWYIAAPYNAKMPFCPRCAKIVSIFSYSIFSGMCSQCKRQLTPQLERQPFDAPSDAVVTAPAVPISWGKLKSNIGIETLGGTFTPILQKETRIPCFKSEVFSTAQDEQLEISLNIFYGESPKVAACQHVGYIVISGIPPAPRGVPQIEMGFQVSTDGALTLKARGVAGIAQIKLNQIKT